ncbi:MAG: TAXI family TRAP transporter solute-binding subunit [Pseudomonadota bacterium]
MTKRIQTSMTLLKVLSKFNALVLGISCLLTSAAPARADNHVSPTFVAVASGAVSGVYYPAAGAICKEVGRDHGRHGIRCAVEATDGSVANMTALREGRSEAAIVQADVLVDAARGRGPEGPFFALRALMTVHQELLAVVVRADSEITGFEDLAGRPVNLGGPGSGQRATVEALMAAAEFDPGFLGEDLGTSPRNIPDELCSGKIDAAFLVAGHPNAILQETALTCPVRFLPMDELAEPLVNGTPAYQMGSIPAGTYAGLDAPVPSFGFSAVLVTTSDLSDDVAFEIAYSTLSKLDAIRAQHPALEALVERDMVAPTYVPFHDGALSAYRELGLID